MPQKRTIEFEIAEEEAKLKDVEPQIEKRDLTKTVRQISPIPEDVVEPKERIPWQPMISQIPILTQEKPVEAPEPFELPEPKTKWYEYPKIAGEKIQTGIAAGLSKVPLVPKALKFVEPVFTFIQEKLEKPWAAMVTSYFSTSLPWREGESWIQHEQREYEKWKAPVYVKGGAEFSMPLWWLPWFGWAAKGAKALGAANKMNMALGMAAKSGKAGKLALPTNEILEQTVFKMDAFKRFALWSEHKPVINKVVGMIGGPAAFVNPLDKTALGILKKELVKRAVVTDMRNGARGLLVPKLQKYGDIQKLLQMSDDGLVGAIKPKAGITTRGLDAIIEHPENYAMPTNVKAFVNDTKTILKDVYNLAQREGVSVPTKRIIVNGKSVKVLDIKFHRIVKGVETLKGYEPSEYGSLFEVTRHYKTMEEGIARAAGKIHYGNDPIESIASTINHYINKIANKRFYDAVKPLGKTSIEKFETTFPEIAETIGKLTARKQGVDYTLKAISRIFGTKGETLPSPIMRKISSSSPELAQRLEFILSVKPTGANKLINRLGAELQRVFKITPREFKLKLTEVHAKGSKIYKMSEFDDAIQILAKDKKLAGEMINKIHKNAYQLNKQSWDDSLRVLQKEAKESLKGINDGLKPLLGERKEFLRRYKAPAREAWEQAGKVAVFQEKHLAFAFKRKFFDPDVVKMAERVFDDSGSKWLAQMASISGGSRMLVAALDFSAPFIQGLGVIGRNPTAWFKGVKNMFSFARDPVKLYEYMSRPEVMAIRSQRIFAGGSSQSFEFFEAMPHLQKALGKTPKIGGALQKTVSQTYGRAEAAFTGFGEVARNELWKASYRPGMSEPLMRELARSIDRMTGVMSTEALAIGMTQRQFESAWLFFAPRYTRAGFSLVADVFKGGLAGAEARKSLGALMGGGASMYYGVCKALGQQPNFDPKSGRFMTVKIGEAHIGIGGMLTSLIRFGYNVAATAAEDPENLVKPISAGKLNRWDNPFMSFMFNKSAPLTGMITGAIEQANYFGEPFETPQDYARFMADKVTPIAMQPVMPWAKEPASPSVFAAEIMGGRTFPTSAWERRQEARDKVSQTMYRKEYNQLSRLEQNEINKNPDVSKWQEQADIQTVQRGDVLSIAFLEWQREREQARDDYVESLEQAQRAVDDEILTPYDFREVMKSAGAGLGTTYEHINKQERYEDVFKKLAEPRSVEGKYLGDVAYDELMGRLSGEGIEDEYGIFDFEKYNQVREEVKQKYGEDVWQYILQREEQRNETLPPLAKEYKQAQKILKPYWDVETEAIKLFGKPKTDAQLKRLQKFISKIRKEMRLTNPEINRYLEMFYTR